MITKKLKTAGDAAINMTGFWVTSIPVKCGVGRVVNVGFGLSRSTIKTHLARIAEKLGIEPGMKSILMFIDRFPR